MMKTEKIRHILKGTDNDAFPMLAAKSPVV